MEKAKPRVSFCWLCGNKLWGRAYREVVFKGDGQTKIVHAACAKDVNGPD